MRNRLSLLVRQPATLDAGLAVLLAGLSVLAVWRLIDPAGLDTTKLKYEFGTPQLQYWHTLGWLAAVGVELGVLPLRRRLPVTVLAVTLGMAAAHSLLLPDTPTPADLAVAIAVFTVASVRPRPISAGAAMAGLLLAYGLDALLLQVINSGVYGEKTLAAIWPVKPANLAVPVLVLAAAWLAGDSARTRRAYVAEVERRAADAERDLDRQAELAAAAERERITRELHDVIAHALSVMVIQAQGAGSALRRRRSAETGEALNAIVTTGRGALAEVRRLLGVVRRPADADPEPELAPQPGLGDLPALAARVRRAGTPVQLRVTGTVRPLASGVELSAYRIIQEALTNTMKHAGPGATAVVGVHYAGPEVVVEITDDGVRGLGGNAPGGHGLAGMQARAAMLGGELTAGPCDGSGFRVRAQLPVAESALLARGDDPPRPPREGMARGDDPPRPPREGMARGDDLPRPPREGMARGDDLPRPDAEPGSASPVEVAVPRSPR